jgi:hypothetical protein
MREHLMIYEKAVSHAPAFFKMFPLFFNSVRSHLAIVMKGTETLSRNEYGGGLFDMTLETSDSMAAAFIDLEM